VDNPIANEKDFRIRVVSILPQLRVLNFQKVTMKVMVGSASHR
jgi:hypothetical protein